MSLRDLRVGGLCRVKNVDSGSHNRPAMLWDSFEEIELRSIRWLNIDEVCVVLGVVGLYAEVLLVEAQVKGWAYCNFLETM